MSIKHSIHGEYTVTGCAPVALSPADVEREQFITQELKRRKIKAAIKNDQRFDAYNLRRIRANLHPISLIDQLDRKHGLSKAVVRSVQARRVGNIYPFPTHQERYHA